MESYRKNYVLNHGAGSLQALHDETKKWARLEEQDEDFLFMIQQTQQLENNFLLVSPPPMSQFDAGCFVYAFTSDKSGEDSASNVEPPLVSLGLSIDLIAQMQQQEDEINTLIKSQNEKVLRLVLEKRQRHLQDIIVSAEKGIATMLKEKEADLESLSRRNIELQAITKQLSMEALMWQKVAKDNEVTVGNLKSNLEKPGSQLRDQQISRESHCDIGDAVSCCYPQQEHSTLYGYQYNGSNARLTMKEQEKWMCRVCRMKSSCIVLLPCRHVCICTDCENLVIACPLCNSSKNASIHVYMS